MAELPISVRSKWRGGSWVEVADGRARFATPNEWHQRACDEGRLAVEKALAEQLGTRLAVEVVVDGATGANGAAGSTTSSSPATSAGGAPGSAGAAADEHDDALSPDEVRELRDADDVATGGVDLLLREFGGELVEEDPS